MLAYNSPVRVAVAALGVVVAAVVAASCGQQGGIHLRVEGPLGPAQFDVLLIELFRPDKALLHEERLQNPVLPVTRNFVSGPKTPAGTEVLVTAKAFLGSNLVSVASGTAILEPDEGTLLVLTLPGAEQADGGTDAGLDAGQPQDAGLDAGEPQDAGIQGQLVFVQAPQSLEMGECAASLLERQDGAGAPLPTTAALSVQFTLSSPRVIGLFLDSACSSAMGPAEIPTGQTSLAFYVQGQLPGAAALTASAVSNGSASANVTVASPDAGPPAPACAYELRRAVVPPVIDAELSEFQAAQPLVISNAAGAVGVYRILWDQSGIYIGAEVVDPLLNAVETLRDGALWRDDSIEVYFDTLHDHGTSRQTDDVKFFVAVTSLQGESRGGYSDYDAVWSSAVAVEGTLNANGDVDNGYRIEMALPWSVLTFSSVPALGTTLGFDLSFNDRVDGAYTQTQWCNSTGGDGNDPNGYGDATLMP